MEREWQYKKDKQIQNHHWPAVFFRIRIEKVDEKEINNHVQNCEHFLNKYVHHFVLRIVFIDPTIHLVLALFFLYFRI